MNHPAELTSRQRMLESTIRLLRESGLSGAGINEIVRASGAPKGSVYHFFPGGKSQIVAEALALYSGRVQDFMETALAGAEAPADKVRALFAAFARRVEEGDFHASCAAGAVCLDLDVDLEFLRLVLAETFADWVSRIAGHFGALGPERARSFASIVLTAIEGAYIRCRAARSSLAFLEVGEWLAPLVGPVGQHLAS